MALPEPAHNRLAVVTGASAGIGADIARQLAGRGQHLALVARRADRLEALAVELRDAHGVHVEVRTADLADPDARLGLCEGLAGDGWEVSVLVNNAGFSTIGPVQGAERTGELNMIRLDVEAVVDLCTLLVPGMVERRSGAVLNVASTAAFQPLPRQAGYGASKAFVLSYTHALRADLHGTGVTVTALCPGPTQSEFFGVAGVEDTVASLPGFLVATSEGVAKAGVDGLAAGRDVVIPGLANRVSALGGQVTPRRVLMPLLRRYYPLA
jgi:short-subunit dehydrogenase